MTARLLALAALALTAAGCDSSASEFVVEGRYSGVTETVGARTTTLTLTLPRTESGDPFTFSAVVVESEGGAETGRQTAPGVGVYDHPRITINVGAETTSGTVSGDGDSIRLEVEGRAATLRR